MKILSVNKKKQIKPASPEFIARKRATEALRDASFEQLEKAYSKINEMRTQMPSLTVHLDREHMMVDTINTRIKYASLPELRIIYNTLRM
jgi:hypothetical protein